MIDARRLLTFREVARLRSFSRAADALALTQPAVSQQVAALERTVGAPLLHRGAGGVRPTAAGELLAEHADAIADRLALAETQLAERVAGDRRRLRIGAFASALATVVPPALARLRADVPQLEVDATDATSDALIGSVGRGDLHAAVVFEDAASPPRELGGLRREELFVEPFSVAVPAGHRLARRRRIGLAELRDDVWTAPSRGQLVVRACRAAGFEPDIAYVTSDPLAIGRLVASGLAVTLTPKLLAESLPGAVLLEVRDAPQRRVYAVSPSRGRHPLAGAFVDAVRGVTA